MSYIEQGKSVIISSYVCNKNFWKTNVSSEWKNSTENLNCVYVSTQAYLFYYSGRFTLLSHWLLGTENFKDSLQSQNIHMKAYLILKINSLLMSTVTHDVWLYHIMSISKSSLHLCDTAQGWYLSVIINVVIHPYYMVILSVNFKCAHPRILQLGLRLNFIVWTKPPKVAQITFAGKYV